MSNSIAKRNLQDRGFYRNAKTGRIENADGRVVGTQWGQVATAYPRPAR